MARGRPFEAKYAGTCKCGCEEWVRVGDLVVFDDDTFMLEDHAPAPEAPLNICPECWLVKPCRCDDE